LIYNAELSELIEKTIPVQFRNRYVYRMCYVALIYSTQLGVLERTNKNDHKNCKFIYNDVSLITRIDGKMPALEKMMIYY